MNTGRAEKRFGCKRECRALRKEMQRPLKSWPLRTGFCHELFESREMTQTRLDPYSMRPKRYENRGSETLSTFQNTVIEYFGTNPKKKKSFLPSLIRNAWPSLTENAWKVCLPSLIENAWTPTSPCGGTMPTRFTGFGKVMTLLKATSHPV